MFSTSPEYRYLSDVLGLQQFVRPEGSAVPVAQMLAAYEAADASVTPSSTIGGVLVIADQALTAPEAELLKKMLGSIKIENYETLVVTSAQAVAGDVAHAQGVIFISAKNSFDIQTQQPSVEIKNFYQMTSDEAHPSETMAYKKAAWADLQGFKKKLKQ